MVFVDLSERFSRYWNMSSVDLGKLSVEESRKKGFVGKR